MSFPPMARQRGRLRLRGTSQRIASRSSTSPGNGVSSGGTPTAKEARAAATLAKLVSELEGLTADLHETTISLEGTVDGLLSYLISS